MSLPVAWVEKIWAKLTLTYGDKFLRQYSSIPSEQLNAVKTDWCHELAGYQNNPGAIAWALSNLPEYPPNVIQFKGLCRSAPRVEPVAAIENQAKADPQRLKAELEKLGGVKDKVLQTAYNPRQWAIDLQARIDAGYRPTIAQRQIVREALNQG